MSASKSKPQTPGLLIETCMVESGPLSELEIRQKLAGQSRTPAVKAVLSRLEWQIGDCRARAEIPGTDAQRRTELLGAVYELKNLRVALLEMTAAEREEVK